ncbi:MAG: MATE family efflux transporter [bacterium]|nr:MATE family efflux transporter [bacterium]MCM1375791.1 MATE family efflux transporter [Muribaculum sp.]
MKERQEYLFQKASVWKAISQMAIPAMVSIIVMIIYNMADMFFVGQLGDTAQVAAVSLVGPVFTLMMAIGTMIGGGGSVLIAKTLGEEDFEKVKLYSSLCCWGGIVFGLIFSAVVVLFSHPLLRFLGANSDTFSYAKQYMLILALGAPITIFANGFGNVIRGEGAVKEGMLGHLLGTVVNIVLDPLFILVLNMGVGGAAVATVLGNIAAALYLLVYIKRSNTNLTLRPSHAAKAPLAITGILALGLPNMINSTLASFAGAFANQLLVQHGTHAVAAMGAAGKSTLIISMIQMGLCMGVQPLMAYCYGAKNMPRLKEVLTKLSILTIAIGLSVTLFCLFNSRTVVSLFLKEPEALALGQQMVNLLVLSGPFLGLFYIGSNFLQASGNVLLATIVSMLRQGIFLIPLLYAMNALFGVTGNIIAHIVSDIAAAAVAVLLAFLQYRKLRQSVSSSQNLSI